MSTVPSINAGDGCTSIDRERRITMGRTIRTLLVLLAAVISLVCVQTARTEDTADIPNPVTGKIEKAYRDLSMIVIRFGDGEGDLVTIAGFPFHNLEAQLDEVWSTLDAEKDGITIAAGDCVTVEYSVKDLCSGDTVYKWESLTAYCEGCITCEDCVTCEENITCEEGSICEACSTCEACITEAGKAGICYVSDMTRVPQQNNHRSKP
jgi:hypothetical protein